MTIKYTFYGKEFLIKIIQGRSHQEKSSFCKDFELDVTGPDDFHYYYNGEIFYSKKYTDHGYSVKGGYWKAIIYKRQGKDVYIDFGFSNYTDTMRYILEGICRYVCGDWYVIMPNGTYMITPEDLGDEKKIGVMRVQAMMNNISIIEEKMTSAIEMYKEYKNERAKKIAMYSNVFPDIGIQYTPPKDLYDTMKVIKKLLDTAIESSAKTENGGKYASAYRNIRKMIDYCEQDKESELTFENCRFHDVNHCPLG